MVRRQTAGVTLLELVLVIGIVALILSSLSLALHLLFRIDRDFRSDANYGTVLPKLTLQIRADSHVARGVRWDDGPEGSAGLTLQVDDQRTITYRLVDGAVHRQVHQDGQPLHQELFRLPPGTRGSWELQEQPSPTVRLRLRHFGPSQDSPMAPRRVDLIEAAVRVVGP